VSARREGVVFVGEEMGIEEPHLLTGRFSRAGGGRSFAFYDEGFDPYDGIRPVAAEDS